MTIKMQMMYDNYMESILLLITKVFHAISDCYSLFNNLKRLFNTIQSDSYNVYYEVYILSILFKNLHFY